jgi:hypothetical protein
MNKLLVSLLIALTLLCSAVLGQKGVDSQNQKIQKESTRTTDKGSEVSRSWSFGAGKTATRPPLPNPMRFNARRDVLIQQIGEVLSEMKIILDERSTRAESGLLVTQPFIFAKGAVITKNELGRYARIEGSDISWTRGRYSLTIEVLSLDGMQNTVTVTAKIEGRSEIGFQSEWNVLTSSGIAEEEFLVRLLMAVTGKTPEEFNGNQ